MGKSDPATALHVPEGKITMPGENVSQRKQALSSPVLPNYQPIVVLKAYNVFLNKHLSVQELQSTCNKERASPQTISFSPFS